MSCCPVGARAPVVVRAQSGARRQETHKNKNNKMATVVSSGLSTAVRRGWSSSSRAALAAAGARPAASVALPSFRAAAAWGGAGANSKDVVGSSRGYATTMFQDKNRHALKAVAEPSDVEVVPEEEPIKLLTSDESEDLLKIRHTTAHICAMATQKLFPDAQCTIGPW